MKRLRIIPATRGMSPVEGAAHWAVLRDARGLTASEEREFAAWLEIPANAEAMHHTIAAIQVFDDAPAGDPTLRALRQAALEAVPARHFPYRLAASGLAAAVVATLLTFSNIGYQLPKLVREPQKSQGVNVVAESGRAEEVDYQSAVGERRVVRLADGTVITLNTHSRVQVAYGDRRRLVRLLRGQALFEVAHEPGRPFIVEAADRQVTALGTIFEVRLDPGFVNVLLVRGRVVVDRIPNANAQFSSTPKATILSPGQQFRAELGAPQKVIAVDVDRQLLWRDGFVEFDDVSLGSAVAEINRYAKKPIILGDDGVSALHISGVYKTDSPDQFVDAVQGILPVVAKPTPQGGIELSLMNKTVQ